MKKTLAILLSLALVICMIPGTAFAEEVTIESIAIGTIADQTFTGSQIKPAVTVTATMTGGTTKTLTATEYTVEYGTNTNVASSGGTVTVKLVADETKTTSANFNIVAYDIEANGITASVDNKTTTGAATGLTIDGVHFYKNGVEVDYAYLTAENLDVSVSGTDPNYIATISGKNNLKGTITAGFKVVADIANTKIATNTYGITVANPESGNATINAGAYNGSGKTISSLFYLVGADNKSIGTGNYTVNAVDEEGAVVTSAKDAGEYTITATGINAYGGTKTIKLNIGQKDATLAAGLVKVDAISGQYSSAQFSSIVPTVRDTSLGILTAGKDYSYRVDSGLVTITFMNNYYGTQTVPFSVVAADKDIANIYNTLGIKINGAATTSYNGSVMYNGTSQAPYVTVSNLSSSYYAIEYRYTDANAKTVSTAYPTDAGVYSMYLVGRNGYGGEISLGTLTITPFEKDWVDVTVSAGYTTSTPYVSVRSFDGKISFVQDKDFKVLSVYPNTYSNKVTVYLSTMGNIESGSLTAEYALVAKPITSCSVYFTNGRTTSAYTGSVISTPITVKDGYTTLTQGTHYTVTYKNSLGKVVSSIRDAGTYTIEITGKGIYSGTTYLTYTVTGKDISHYTVTLKESSVQANGYSKVPTITSVKDGYYTTLSSSNYTVTYKNYLGETVTSMSAPGTYTVVVTGKNGYQGSTSATFRIVGLDQEVTITNGTSKKVYEDSDSFKLTAKATGDGTGFTWTTSDPTVATVSYNGTVTVVGVGRAKITATTTGNKKYNPEEASFIVKVYPDKVKQTKKPWTDGKKGQLKVRWGYQEGVTKYEIRYSTSKSFSTYSTKTVNAHGKDYETQSTTLKNLKSGKTYYIKVRAVYQTYNEEGTKITYRGAWSPWRSAKTK